MEGSNMTRRRSLFSNILTTVLSCLVPVTPAVAQWETTPEGTRECALAVSRLDDPDPTIRRSALSSLVECPRIATPIVAAAWASLPTDSVSIEIITGLSLKFRDGRILSAVLAAARNHQGSRLARLSAISALTTLFDPWMTITYREPWDSSRGAPAYVAIGHYSHPGAREGEVPLPSSARTDILATLRELEKSDPDPVIQKVAGYVARELSYDLQGAKP